MNKHWNSILFSVAIIVAAIVLGNAFVNRNRAESQISVTGLGEKNFQSDLIVWEGSFSRENMSLKTASAELNSDKILIENYLIKNGVSRNSVVFSAITISEMTRQKYSQSGERVGEEFAGYKLTQSIEITSKEIEKIEGISRRITELLNEGIQFNSENPRYYYTKLADLKILLVSEATKDARERAEKIAEESGSKLGNLISAQMGIIQITGQNSNEDYSWGGTYNTSSKEKTASITMKLTYKVR
ncbi:MAG: SIMPL domain-containing protein [Bacteroidales bacterium]|nr:SIMPL domain-containing protein [Bacteroidales bacterium]MDD4713080.1 SIMPL domain-containing protein [Bacteroidales bacterium]